MTASVLDFELEKSRRIVAHERVKSEERARREAARAVAADEAATGAQLEVMWANALSRHTDPTQAVLLLVAEVVDELLEADSLEQMKVAALQVANGARMAALMRARRARR